MKIAGIVGASLLLLTSGFISPAVADQCAWVGKSQALAALNYLSIGQTIYSFCELCGDKAPKPVLIDKLSIINADNTGKFWKVLVNNDNIDLAYTYIKYSPKYQVNLAVITKCPAEGFTPVLPAKSK
jgi:hypothetical protein